MSHTEEPLRLKYVSSHKGAELEIQNVTSKSIDSILISPVSLNNERYIHFQCLDSIGPRETTKVNHECWIKGEQMRGADDFLAELLKIGEGLELNFMDEEGNPQHQQAVVSRGAI